MTRYTTLQLGLRLDQLGHSLDNLFCLPLYPRQELFACRDVLDQAKYKTCSPNPIVGITVLKYNPASCARDKVADVFELRPAWPPLDSNNLL